MIEIARASLVERMHVRSSIPVLVGESPSWSAPRAKPWVGHSGHRLARMVGVTLEQLLLLVEARNVLDEPLPNSRGWRAMRAGAIALAPLLAYRPVILAGSDVARAFGVAVHPRLEWRTDDPSRVGWHAYAVIPHPSGRSREMNDPGVRSAVAAFVRRAAGLEEEST